MMVLRRPRGRPTWTCGAATPVLITPELNDTDPVGHIVRWVLERDVHLRPAVVFVEEHEPLASMTGILAASLFGSGRRLLPSKTGLAATLSDPPRSSHRHDDIQCRLSVRPSGRRRLFITITNDSAEIQHLQDWVA